MYFYNYLHIFLTTDFINHPVPGIRVNDEKCFTVISLIYPKIEKKIIVIFGMNCIYIRLVLWYLLSSVIIFLIIRIDSIVIHTCIFSVSYSKLEHDNNEHSPNDYSAITFICVHIEVDYMTASRTSFSTKFYNFFINQM